ncbi:hypothetical protein M378DRAFT_392870 [Amanita muscaria Koide BX008]|uniref:Uncharacterized protein n=1 Tax=Amanita muscaria (strain Koide BX008) TaxID=946122 RepID=A0A0C2WME4_AMAMK|nr:hypothetical protein M378DRAFT_392870 [Amanita muscaria Koide BX008]
MSVSFPSSLRHHQGICASLGVYQDELFLRHCAEYYLAARLLIQRRKRYKPLFSNFGKVRHFTLRNARSLP